MAKPKIAVLLSGCGVYDGAEIQEAVITMLTLKQAGAEYQCIAPDMKQYHVVNHITGEEVPEERNVLVESARIARGDIIPLNEVIADDYYGLAIPGGFGDAKNLTKWAFSGPDGEILPDVKRIVNEFVKAGKPVAGMCMGPTVIAKALEGSGVKATVTVGNTEEPSPYDMAAIIAGVEKTGAISESKSVDEIAVDEKNKIVTCPCYNMEATISDIYEGINKAMKKLVELT